MLTPRRGTSRNARVDSELEEVPGGRAAEINDPGSGVRPQGNSCDQIKKEEFNFKKHLISIKFPPGIRAEESILFGASSSTWIFHIKVKRVQKSRKWLAFHTLNAGNRQYPVDPGRTLRCPRLIFQLQTEICLGSGTYQGQH